MTTEQSLSPTERKRVDAVRRTGLLDTPPEEAFDGLTRLARTLIGAPVAFLSLVDAERDFYKSSVGFPEPLRSAREMRGETFCHHAIKSPDYLAIEDARADPLYCNVPTVRTLGVVAYFGVPLRMKSGQTIGSLCVIDFVPHKWSARDVEVMLQLAASATREIELRQALRDVQAAERELRFASLGHLSTKMAHEFNNVLMGLQAFSDLIGKKAGGDSSLQTAANHMADTIRRGRAITSEILRFTQPVSLETSSINVEAWMSEVLAVVHATVGGNITVVASLPEPDIYMEADPLQLQQMLLNVIANARAAMPGGGTLTIAAGQCPSHPSFSEGPLPNPERYVHLTVQDTGGGIPSGDLPHIFEPLFTTTHGGSGLGLAIVRQVIAAHGGLIFVETSVETGTRIHLLVPRALPPMAGMPPAPSDTRGTLPNAILIVEDDDTIRLGLTVSLELEGIAVDAVSTGGAAVAAIEASLPEVVLLDVSLPDMSGFDVYRSIRQRWPSLRVIFSSGHATAADEIGLDGDVRFLAKPYGIETLLDVLREFRAPAMQNAEG